ncbi:MAG: FAD-dependent oxidoreductase [Candidatus Fermentibacteraceae bacterium]|nr:FAD-dependent oxidoreductase [Candidatus Fermentibacteraceae bacterium]
MESTVHVIVGAGVTGLTTAVELEKQGKTVVILEASKHYGGMSRSFTMDGVVFDLGPHMLMLNPNKPCGVYLRKLLRHEEMYRRRYKFEINNGERIWRSPVTPAELLRYPAWARQDVLRSLLHRKNGNRGRPTLDNYISRRSGRKIYSSVFKPLIRKKLGKDGSDIHENWWLRPPKNVHIGGHKSPPIPGRPTPKAILGRFLHDLMPMYLYPKSGMGTVTELLRKQFKGRLITSCGDIRLSGSAKKITEVSFSGTELKAASLVWTAPVREFYKALSEETPAATETISTRLVFITFKADTLPKRPNLYTYFTGTDTVFTRVYSPRSIFRDDSPEGLEGFCFEIRSTDRIRSMSHEQLIDITASDALRTGIAPGSIISARVIDINDSSSLFAVDYLEKEKALFSAINRFSNLVFAGRHGNYFNCLLPGAVEQGLLAAERIENASV